MKFLERLIKPTGVDLSQYEIPSWQEIEQEKRLNRARLVMHELLRSHKISYKSLPKNTFSLETIGTIAAHIRDNYDAFKLYGNQWQLEDIPPEGLYIPQFPPKKELITAPVPLIGLLDDDYEAEPMRALFNVEYNVGGSIKSVHVARIRWRGNYDALGAFLTNITPLPIDNENNKHVLVVNPTFCVE